MSRVVVLAKPAISDYKGILGRNKATLKQIINVLKWLGKDPSGGRPLRLELKNLCVYRVGIYRIIYGIETNLLKIYAIRY
ncbi:MAG: type II toxin-antitoxin system RelE/ParE family toxin [Candidatus Omnitrophica bacterium]|nr:type II toxin-antitoxin system RelE/ParE family toxin [Candidatus Omnitrophota bacterium]